MYIKIIGAIALAGFAHCAHAELYRCKAADGQMKYQDTPCPGSLGKPEFRDPKPKPPPEAAPSKPKATLTAASLMRQDEELRGLMLAAKISSARKLSESRRSDAEDCMEKYRSTLKNPRSGYIVESAAYQDNFENFVAVDVSAQNGFGGAARLVFVCAFP